MPSKSVPISLRISDDDASFLAGLEIDGALTISDKIRALIKEARRLRSDAPDHSASIHAHAALLEPFQVALHEAEAAQRRHSELLPVLTRWLPETLTELSEASRPLRSDPASADLASLEGAAADRIFNLFDQTLRLGVTTDNPCFDSMAVTRRAKRTAKLFSLVEHAGREIDDE